MNMNVSIEILANFEFLWVSNLLGNCSQNFRLHFLYFQKKISKRKEKGFYIQQEINSKSKNSYQRTKINQ